MNIALPVPAQVTRLKFGLFTQKEIEKISVKEITNPDLLDFLGHPNHNGLYDLALGPYLKGSICATCKLDERFCPGHFGHIILPIPIYHPFFFNWLLLLLRSTCVYCHRLKLNRAEVHRFVCKLKLIDIGCIEEAQSIDNIHINSPSSFPAEDEEFTGESTFDKAKDIDHLIELREIFVSRARRKALKNFDESVTFPSLVYDTKRSTIKAFSKIIVSRKKCEKCNAFSPSYRKEAHNGIMEVPLSSRTQRQMEAFGMQRPNMLSPTKKSAKKENTDSVMFDSSYDRSEDVSLIRMKRKTSQKPRIISSLEVRNHMMEMFSNEQEIIKQLFLPCYRKFDLEAACDIFFLRVLAVPPTRYRPPSKVGDNVHENPQNDVLEKVLRTSQRIRELNDQLSQLDTEKLEKDLYTRLIRQVPGAMLQLQSEVNMFMDASKSGQIYSRGHEPPPGIKQILEKKEGLFRKHMMGKRVNFAARSVISPDPNIETYEIGVPLVFAKKLTYPEPVTSLNVQQLRDAVINGPDEWPGASAIQKEDGSMVSLKYLNVEQRTALANQLLTPQAISAPSQSFARVCNTNKKVLRHLKNGDMVILNRQPTLHKPSMMTHIVRVLPGEKTIRMHYANCNSYNADFDGDEMNLHFPQNELARSEASFIANTNSQYLVPTSGSPLRGLIQDHVVSAVWMTSKDSFFTKGEYQQLLCAALRFDVSKKGSSRSRIITLPPCIWKPQHLWSGKQIISTCLKNLKANLSDGRPYPPITIYSRSKIPSRYWDSAGEEEGETIFYEDEFVTGILDKSQIGASSNGLVHSIYELWGSQCAGELLSVLGRLFTSYLQRRGFTCRMDDLQLNSNGDETRSRLLKNSENYGDEAAAQFVGLDENATITMLNERLENVSRDDQKLAGLDATMKSKMNLLTSTIINECIPDGLHRRFPDNHMQTMTVSGAKGSNVNVSQISCLLGQQELEGRRVPLMVSGKTLPSFSPYETSARAGGYITQRFLTGIKPQEYFFHCMAGREGLIDTAVKTSRSGYLQRCLIKHMEGLTVAYDQTVRDSDGSLVQFNYGDDSLEVVSMKHLKEFSFNKDNYETLIYKLNIRDVVQKVDTETAGKLAKKALTKPYKYDPVLSKLNPSIYIGAVSESFTRELNDFIAEHPQDFVAHKHKSNDNSKSGDKTANTPEILRNFRKTLSAKDFKNLMNLKYQQSLVQPGEMVGILAGQSIGEPSTQMTLNTFHFAGFGAKNVTLGIPRLTEILNASHNVSTPLMNVKVLDSVSHEEAIKFCKEISELRMSDLVDYVEVFQSIKSGSDSIYTEYEIKLIFFTKNECFSEYEITPEQIEASLDCAFLKNLSSIISAHFKKKKNSSSADDNSFKEDISRSVEPLNANATGRGSAVDTGDGILEENDATEEKIASKAKQQASYDSVKPQKEVENSDSGDELNSNYGDSSDEDETEISIALNATNEGAPCSSNKSLHGRQNDERLKVLKSKFPYVQDFYFNTDGELSCIIKLGFPIETEKLLMTSLTEKACEKTLIQSLKGIHKAFFEPADNISQKRSMISTEGINIRSLWNFMHILDVNSIYANEIYSCMEIYGIEAARQTIVSEVSSVFGVYGIEVDKRHLSLLADYMTFEGDFKPYTRKGLESSASPLAKMSFETSCHFLSQAALHEESDALQNPSAGLVLGKVASVGTGSFDVLVDWQQKMAA